MKLVIATIACRLCGDTMNAVVPLSALDARIDCCVCGEPQVVAVPGKAAVLIPESSPVALEWHLGVEMSPYLARTGGAWARA